MRYEKKIKREDGSRVKICIDMYTDNWTQHVEYSVSVSIRLFKKSPFIPVENGLEIAGNDAIKEALLECWEKGKPLVG